MTRAALGTRLLTRALKLRMSVQTCFIHSFIRLQAKRFGQNVHVFGRMAVVEYKGAHLLNLPYEIEKRQVGELWAKVSEGKCLFGQIVLQRDGLDMKQQLDTLLAA